MKTYVIVENAGYENERECDECQTFREALAHLKRSYSNAEQESLHVQIAKRLPDGSLTYEY